MANAGIDPRLLEILVCPLTKAPLRYDAAAQELIEAYGFLRRVEHRLQMIDDRQTHEIPDSPAGVEALAGHASRFGPGIRLAPHVTDTDGFYVSVLVKS